jgi:hypothetical protein
MFAFKKKPFTVKDCGLAPGLPNVFTFVPKWGGYINHIKLARKPLSLQLRGGIATSCISVVVLVNMGF